MVERRKKSKRGGYDNINSQNVSLPTPAQPQTKISIQEHLRSVGKHASELGDKAKAAFKTLAGFFSTKKDEQTFEPQPTPTSTPTPTPTPTPLQHQLGGRINKKRSHISSKQKRRKTRRHKTRRHKTRRHKTRRRR